MLNFYRRFLPDIAKTLVPINELQQGNMRKDINIMVNKS